MKKLIVLLAIALLSFNAAAQVCEQTMTMTLTYKGQAVAKSTITYSALDEPAVKDIAKRGLKVVDAGAQAQDKGGNYTMTLGESHVCDGKTTTTPEMEFQGLQINGVTKILRAMGKEGEGLAKVADDGHGKGKKRMWGKE